MYHLVLSHITVSADGQELCQKLSLPLFCWTPPRVGQASAGLGALAGSPVGCRSAKQQEMF